MVRNGSMDPWGGPGRVGGNLGEVRDGSGDPPGGPGGVWDSGMFGTGRGTIVEVRDELRVSRRDSGWVGGPTEWTGMGRWTLGEV